MYRSHFWLLAALTLWVQACKTSSTETAVLPVAYQDGPFLVKAYVRSDKSDPSRAVPHYVYSSYTQGQAITQQGGFTGRLFQGRYEVFFPNKQLRTQGQYHAGMAIGYWKHWYPNGKLQTIELYSHGRLHGPSKKYNEQGALVAIARYHHGELHGCSKIISSNGKMSKSWFRHGLPRVPLHKKMGAWWNASWKKWTTRKTAGDSISNNTPPSIKTD